MARICLISPGQIGSNPRIVKEAQLLHDAGHDVQVIATKVADFVEPRDQAIMAKASYKITRVNFQNKLTWRLARLRQQFAAFCAKHLGMASARDFAHSPMTGKLVAKAQSVPADLYVAHYVAALPAAARAAKKHDAIFAFDGEDFHPGGSPDVSAFEEARDLIKDIEGRYLPSCAYVTSAAPGISDAYAEAYQIERPTTVLNVFPLSEATGTVTDRGNASPGPSIYWFSQTVGPNRGLECAIKALAICKTKPHLYLRGTPSANYPNMLRLLASDLGVTKQLHFLPPGPPAKMVELASAYDIGLVGETGETHNRRIALTNKQFTYFLAGVPALMSDVEAHKTFAERAEGAVELYTVEDPKSCAAAIDYLLEDTDTLSRARHTAFELAQTKFNWDAEKEILLHCVNSALDNRSNSMAAAT